MSVSVVIPCHNYGRYLEQCVESVRSQGVDAEIIVVDDASDDDASAVAERLGVRCLRTNHGHAHGPRCDGFHATSGEYVCFLDADDWIGPGYLSLALKALQSERSVVAYTDMRLFTDTGEKKMLRLRRGNIEKHNYIHAGSVCKRSALAKCRVMDHELPDARNRYADWWIWRHLLHAGGDAVWTPGIYWYRQHSTSLSHVRKKLPDSHLYCRDVTPIWERV